MHKLLSRQLRRSFGSLDQVPRELATFIEAIDRTYGDVDEERALFERSMMIASEELYARNAKLRSEHEELEKTLEALREETRTADSLFRIAQAITGELDLQVLMQRVISMATSAINADFGLLCCNAPRNQLSVEPLHEVAGSHTTAATRFGKSLGECDGERLIAALGTARFQDTSHPPPGHEAQLICAAALSAGMKCLLVVPVRRRNGAITGAMFFAHAQSGALTPRDQRLIEGIVSPASIAIENARLFRAAQEANEKLAHQALYDALTGLPSRALFRQRLEEALAHSHADPSYQFAVLFVDLDGFKAVNDSHGHEAGDKILRATAERIWDCAGKALRHTVCEPRTTVARLGGDEFTVLVDCIDKSQLEAIGQELIDVLASPFLIDGTELEVSASVGIARGNHANTSIDEIIREADAAMYHAKASGRACYAIYDAHVHDSIQKRAKLEADLWDALEAEEFFLQYQPITCLSTRKLAGFEALIRWRRNGKVIGPGEFIPIAEQSSLIVDIGKWVIDRACRQYEEWSHALGAPPDITVSVNLSRRQLIEPSLVEYISGRLQAYDMPASRLKLEITESMVMQDMETSMRALQALRELGVGLQMDDFGTGHSSLAYLNSLPLDGLKIDRMFIRNVSYRRDCLAILQAIISLAHNLQIAVVAEGIEEPEQVVLLQALDCDFAQGFYFARPLDAAPALELISTQFLPLSLHHRAAA